MIYSDEDVEHSLIEDNNASSEGIFRALSLLKRKGCTWGDVYIQKTTSRDWLFEEGRIKTGSYTIDKGVGVRGVVRENSFLSHSNIVSDSGILDLAGAVASGIAESGAGLRQLPCRFSKRSGCSLYTREDPTAGCFIPIQLSLLEHADAYARSLDERIVDVVISYQTEEDLSAVFRLDGRAAFDARPMSYMSIAVVVEESGRRERASSGGGGRVDHRFFSLERIRRWIRSAFDEAVHNLHAEPAPAGRMPVVLGPGWPGILLHEAVGHGLEADFIRRETSSFTKKMGSKIASEVVTIVDDGSIPGLRGSMAFDDEGTETRRTVLIEDGIMTGVITDVVNAEILGIEPTGNGRRESFASLPLPRMTNTFMLSGKSSPEEIIASVDKGIYASNFNGGQVDITSGNFVFNMSRAWLIENGRITRPIKGAMLSGSGADALLNVVMVGNDSGFDEGTGQCGKDGQSVPVTVGMPTLRIDNLTVGGTVL